MDWFEKITGFKETDYHETQSRLSMQVVNLHSMFSEKVFQAGKFDTILRTD